MTTAPGIFKLDMSMMFAMHDALRRELEQIARVTAGADGDPRRVLRTAPGWLMFKNYLHAHHTSEDDLLWPVMEQALAERPDDLALLADLESEHAAIDPLLAAVDATITDPDAPRGRLADLTDALYTTLTSHLRHEEKDGLSVIDAFVSEQQWQRFGGEHSKRIGEPDVSRYLPWLLHGMDETRASHIIGRFPEQFQATYRSEWRPAFVELDRWSAVGE